MRRRDLKMQKYMSEIVRDALVCWVYFSKVYWRITTTPIIWEGYNTAVL